MLDHVELDPSLVLLERVKVKETFPLPLVVFRKPASCKELPFLLHVTYVRLMDPLSLTFKARHRPSEFPFFDS